MHAVPEDPVMGQLLALGTYRFTWNVRAVPTVATCITTFSGPVALPVLA